MSTTTPRPATSADRAAIEDLLAESGLPTAGVAEVLMHRPADFLVVDDPTRPGVLAAVAGLEVCVDDEPAASALLRSVAVRPAWRAHGLGGALVHALVDAAAARGLDALYLLTTTAEAYFRRFGFAQVARESVPVAVRGTIEFTSACPATAVAMAKPLAVRPTPALHAPFRVLVLCTGNSARSQIGEALLATRGATHTAGRVEAASAGSRPAARVNPYAVEVLRAHGIAWDGCTPKSIDDVSDERFDLVVTVCDNARDACPYFPRAAAQVHWGLPDPADETEPAAARRAFAATYDALAARVDALLALPLESLDAGELRARVESIHAQAPGAAWAPSV